jgi:hypothetical protein
MTDKRPTLDGHALSEIEPTRIRRQIESLETIDVGRDPNAGPDRQQRPHPAGEDQIDGRAAKGPCGGLYPSSGDSNLTAECVPGL